MTDPTDFDGLIGQLEGLAGALAVDDTDIVVNVLDRIAADRPGRTWSRWTVAAAIVALVVAAGVVVHPGTRSAVAGWLGLDGLTIGVDPDLPVSPPPVSFEGPGPGSSRRVVVGDREILVSAIRGSLSRSLISKTVGTSDQVVAVEVDGHPGLWISGGRHEVLYEATDGDIAVVRGAANTLLWTADGVLYRVEGFDRLDDVLAFVEGT